MADHWQTIGHPRVCPFFNNVLLWPIKVFLGYDSKTRTHTEGVPMKLFNFRIPDRLDAAIKEQAAQEGVSASHVVRSALEASLAQTKALTTAR